MKQLLFAIASVIWYGSVSAQSAYQQVPTLPQRREVPPVVQQTVPTAPSVTEAKLLKLYYEEIIQKKDRQLEQLKQETARQQNYISRLNSEKDGLVLSNEMLHDSLTMLMVRPKPAVAASSVPMPSTQSSYSPVTYSTTTETGVRKSITSTSGGGYMYSEISPRKAPVAKRTTRSQQVYQLGPRGGCFYYTASGRKEYVDRSLCH